MECRKHAGWSGVTLGIASLVLWILALLAPGALKAAPSAVSGEVTFAKDIAPILQRSCQNCHQPDGMAPMSLVTYEDVRPWARAMKTRTGLGPRMGVMPPWHIDKTIGIQHYKDDFSLSEEEIAKIAAWADHGAPLGNPADMPPPRHFDDASTWRIGKPDLIVASPEVTVKADAADWYGALNDTVPTGLIEDRYVAAVEVKEVNDVPKAGPGRATVGGRTVFHHMRWSAYVPVPGQDAPAPYDEETITIAGGSWPTLEVGRNADIFDEADGRLLRAGSRVVFMNGHLHSNGRDTKAKLLLGFKFHPKGYKPTARVKAQFFGGLLARGVDMDIRPMDGNQQQHAYRVLEAPTKIISFEPHMHAPGMRMCLEAIWGTDIQTLSCAGYDHSWVRNYVYAEGAQPLLPKGTILHIIGYVDNSPTNKNVPDPRNWQGAGNRSVANMFLDLGQSQVLSDEEFQQEMAKRREQLRRTNPDIDVALGCPLCFVTPSSAPTASTAGSR